MSDDVDTSGCLTKAQAAQLVGTSTKGIERAVAAGDLVQYWRRQKGSPDVAVYFHDELVALVAKRDAQRRRGPSGGVLVPSPAVGSANGNGHRPTGPGLVAIDPSALSPLPPAVVTPGEDVLTVLIAAARRLVSQTSETSQTRKLMLTIPEAAAVSGFSQAYLRRKCQAGWSGAIKDGSTWKIRRKDLKAL